MQLTKDQVEQLVNAVDAAARWVTDAKSVTAWTRVIARICANHAQTVKDSFATSVIVDQFPQLTPHVTTEESVLWLVRAIFNITNGDTQATRDAFSSPAIVALFPQLGFARNDSGLC